MCVSTKIRFHMCEHMVSGSSPPPQRKQRARSFPVPRGRMATGGCMAKLALSAKRIKLITFYIFLLLLLETVFLLVMIHLHSGAAGP